MVRDTGASLFELDEGSLAYFYEVDQTIEPDSHVTLVPFYKVRKYILFNYFVNFACVERICKDLKMFLGESYDTLYKFLNANLFSFK